MNSSSLLNLHTFVNLACFLLVAVVMFVASRDLVLPGTGSSIWTLPAQQKFGNPCLLCCSLLLSGTYRCSSQYEYFRLKLYIYIFFNRCCRHVVRCFQGPGSWMAIDLPEATSLSGIEASFEDGDRRTQKFDIVLVGESEVRATTLSTHEQQRSAPASILLYLHLLFTTYLLSRGTIVNRIK